MFIFYFQAEFGDISHEFWPKELSSLFDAIPSEPEVCNTSFVVFCLLFVVFVCFWRGGGGLRERGYYYFIIITVLRFWVGGICFCGLFLLSCVRLSVDDSELVCFVSC